MVRAKLLSAFHEGHRSRNVRGHRRWHEVSNCPFQCHLDGSAAFQILESFSIICVHCRLHKAPKGRRCFLHVPTALLLDLSGSGAQSRCLPANVVPSDGARFYPSFNSTAPQDYPLRYDVPTGTSAYTPFKLDALTIAIIGDVFSASHEDNGMPSHAGRGSLQRKKCSYLLGHH